MLGQHIRLLGAQNVPSGGLNMTDYTDPALGRDSFGVQWALNLRPAGS